MEISDTVWKHLIDVYGEVEKLDYRIDTNSNGTPTRRSSSGIYYPAWLGVIRDALKTVGFGEGQYLVDLGVGDGRVLEIGHLMGGHVEGPEKDLVMFNVAWNTFDELDRRGVSVPHYEAIHYGRDILKYRISHANIVWAYLMAGKEILVAKKFHEEAKPGSKLMIYNGTPECHDTIERLLSLKWDVEADRNHHLFIAEKK